MTGLNIAGKVYFVTGVANKKSVAAHIANVLIDNGAKVIFSAQSETQLAQIKKLYPGADTLLLDVEKAEDLKDLKKNILKYSEHLDGLVHSMAFANFSEGIKPFHETKLEDYLQACHISSFSLIQITNEIKDVLNKDASIVTIGISNTKATSYGYLGPIKAMLEASVSYLAKSLSEFSQIRVNSIGSGPLKTSASAGIPDYVDNFIYSEALTLRNKALNTTEVANTALFLLSPLSSGINAENIIVDAGMNSNYFEQKVVKKFNE